MCEPQTFIVQFRERFLPCDLPIQQRLQDMFASVWLKIPEELRASLLTFWNGHSTILLLPEEYFDGVQSSGLAGVTADGRVLTFRLDVLNLMPDDALEFLIAHELAHCVLRANGQAARIDQMTDDEYAAYMSDRHDDEPEEKQGDQMAMDWGFSKERFDAFNDSNIDWHDKEQRQSRILLRQQGLDSKSTESLS